MLLGEILRLAAERSPEKTAVIAGARRLSFAAYDRLANRFANLLLSSGVRPGDRVACALFNGPEYGIVHFGNARAGSVLVHVPPLYAASEIARIVERTRPRALVFDAVLRDRFGPETLRAVGTAIAVGATGAAGFEEAIGAQPDHPPALDLDPAAPVAMTFTGGATGVPKGAVVSHAARHASAVATAREHGVTDRDVAAVVTPMFHAVGLMIWHQAAVLAGATSVLFREWDPAEFIAEAERRRVSSVFLVPVQVRDLLRSPAFDRDRLASLTNIGVGGAPTPPGLISEWSAALPHCGYTDHYGQSETGPLTILKPADAGSHAGTVGRPAAGVELRIVDPKGDPRPPGVVGELIARGPFLMDGYFEDEEETARYFRSGDGWGWSGDLAVADEEGFVRLVGRSRELIISGGFNIHPGEVEAALGSHPAVEDCAVFGVPDERWGEAPIAQVVAAGRVSPEELMRHCVGRLARFKRPREIVFVERIPRTPSGKVRKQLLRESYLAGPRFRTGPPPRATGTASAASTRCPARRRMFPTSGRPVCSSWRRTTRTRGGRAARRRWRRRRSSNSVGVDPASAETPSSSSRRTRRVFRTSTRRRSGGAIMFRFGPLPSISPAIRLCRASPDRSCSRKRSGTASDI